MGNIADKLKSFGWNTVRVDGHDLEQIHESMMYDRCGDKPTCIILDTIKGHGVSFMTDPEWHAKAPSDEEYKQALKELGYESN